MGFEFIERNEGLIVVKDRSGVEVNWELLAEIPFTSDRKRMSVIIKHPYTKKYMILTKGADSIMLQRMVEADYSQLNE